MINVTGILVDPMNQPVSTVIRITSENNEVTVLGSEASITTDVNGAYDFDLVEGRFYIDMLTTDEYTSSVLILVDGDTPSVIDLGTLLAEHTAVPQVDINALEVRVAANEAAIPSNLSSRLSSTESGVVSLTSRVSTTEGDVTALDSRVTTTEDNASNLLFRVGITESDISNLAGRVTTLESA